MHRRQNFLCACFVGRNCNHANCFQNGGFHLSSYVKHDIQRSLSCAHGISTPPLLLFFSSSTPTMNVFRPSKSPPPLDLPRKLTMPSGESFYHCSLKHFSNHGSYRSHAPYIYFYEIAHLGPPSFCEKQGHTVVGYGFIGDIYWDLAADPAQLFIRYKDKWVAWSAPQPPTHPIFLDRCLWGTTDPSLDPQGRFGFGWFRLDTLSSRGILLINFSHAFSLLAKDMTKALRNSGGQGARFWADPQTQRWGSWSFSEEAGDGNIMAGRYTPMPVHHLLKLLYPLVSGSSPLPVKNQPLTLECRSILNFLLPG